MDSTAFCDLILKRKPSDTDADYLPKAKARVSVEVKIGDKSPETLVNDQLKVHIDDITSGNDEQKIIELLNSNKSDFPSDLIECKEESQDVKISVEETCVAIQEIKNSQGDFKSENKAKLDLIDDIMITRKIEQNEGKFEVFVEEEAKNSPNPEKLLEVKDSGMREELKIVEYVEESKIFEAESGIIIRSEFIVQGEKESECHESEKFYTPLERTPESNYADCISGNKICNEDQKILTEQVVESHSSHSTEMLTDVQSTQDPISDSSGFTEVIDEI